MNAPVAAAKWAARDGDTGRDKIFLVSARDDGVLD